MSFRGRGEGSEITPLADMLKQNKAVGDMMRIKTRIEAREVRSFDHGLCKLSSIAATTFPNII